MFIVPQITYCRITDANRAIAITNNGGTSDSVLEEVINPVSLITGKITTSNASTSVTGTQTTFLSQLLVGDYLYDYDANGAPELIGKIATISNNTTLTLTENALFTRTNKHAGSSRTILRGTENIYARIPVSVTGRNANGIVTQELIPNFNEWRLPNNNQGLNGVNDPSSSNLFRYSNPGDVISVDSTPTDENNISFTFRTLNQFKISANKDTFWSLGELPNYIWIEINPYGDNGIELAQSTMFYLFTKTVFDQSLVATINFSRQTLVNAGYTLL